jgi:SEC-C motif-containing protein
MNCSCGTEKAYEKCCGPFLSGDALPETAEELMRSRYSAFTRADIEYIKKTMAAEAKEDFDVKGTQDWAEQAKWMGLQIIDTKDGGEGDETGMVEFTATYEIKGDAIDHHEVAQFRRDKKGAWLFVEGDAHTHKAGEGHHHHEPVVTAVRTEPKIGRNDPCTCGSGKKYKKCCAAAA